MPVTRSSSKAAKRRPGAGRKRKAESPVTTNAIVKPAKRQRTAGATVTSDQQWLKAAIKEFGGLSYPKNSERHESVELAKTYLPLFVEPTKKDGHVFEDENKARNFLIESGELEVPMFVANGANFGMIDPTSSVSPIQQMFNLFPDPQETMEYVDSSKPADSPYVKTTMGELRKRFQKKSSKVRYPVNFPDIPTHLMDHGLPVFLKTPTCLTLHNMLRSQLDVNEEHICFCEKPNIPDCGHEITFGEYMRLSTAWIYWQGTIMISEPGTISNPHWDQYSMPTWISCLHGEIGYAWLVRPTRSAQIRWLTDMKHPKGRYAFRVLRAGETLYMPPGVVHFVFRRPTRGPTLGLAGHVLRKQDLAAWLKMLSFEMVMDVWDAGKNGEKWGDGGSAPLEAKSPHEYIIPPLLRQVRILIKDIRARKGEAEFGGGERLCEALNSVAEIERYTERLGEL